MSRARYDRFTVAAAVAAALLAWPGGAKADGLPSTLPSPSAGADCTADPGPMFHGLFRRLAAMEAPNGTSGAAQRVALFAAFDAMFTTRPLAEAALGRYWDEADEAARRDYLELFHFYFMENYLGMAVEASRRWIDRMVARPLPNGEAVIALDAPELKDPEFRALEVHVAPAPCGLALVDVRAAGLSLAEMMRAEFQSVARAGGIDALIERLQDRALRSAAWERWQARR